MSSFVAEIALVLQVMAPFSTDVDPKDVRCLAQNIYHEARQENIEGQKAVALVTLNRVNSDMYADSVCDVVYQTRTRKGKKVAQFSWVTDNPEIDLDNPIERGAFETASELAVTLLASNTPDNVYLDGAMFYFNPDKAKPQWANSMWEVARIGNHVFMVDTE